MSVRKDFPVARLWLRGELVAQTPLHVGGYGTDPDTDLPLARNGAGEYAIPGTSLAGALRDWCMREFSETEVDLVWGSLGDDGNASRILVEDMKVAETAVIAEMRDGVGIDRDSGSAADGFKYDRAILPRGTALRMVLLAEPFSDAEYELVEAMFGELKRALEAKEVRLGAAKTRGMGLVKLYDAKFEEVARLNTRAGIIARLQNKPTEVEPGRIRVRKGRRLRIGIVWHAVGPMMVKSGTDGLEVDSMPLVSGVNGGVSPVLPGSSVKGSLRSHAERIVRTIRHRGEPTRFVGEPRGKDEDTRRDEFNETIAVPLVDRLFGSRGTGNHEVSRRDELGLGALTLDDCYAKKEIPLQLWGEILAAPLETAEANGLMPKLAQMPGKGMGQWTPAYHSAVDRWTGGAADKMLYIVMEPFGIPWEDMSLTADLTRLGASTRTRKHAVQESHPTEEKAALSLLFLVLRDLAKGRIPLGFAVNRGMGAVRVESIAVTGDDPDDSGYCGDLKDDAAWARIKAHLGGSLKEWFDKYSHEVA